MTTLVKPGFWSRGQGERVSNGASTAGLAARAGAPAPALQRVRLVNASQEPDQEVRRGAGAPPY